VNEHVKPDVVFWTGDIVPHDQWQLDLHYVKENQRRLAEFFKANFSDYALYPLEGNHDFEVANS